MAFPLSLKPILPFVQRAQECQRSQPVVAYYCRTYAVEQGIQIRDKDDPKTTEYLKTLMAKLEQDKSQLEGQIGPDAQLVLEGFALQVFQKADDEDRAGQATKNTAKAFYAASLFMEALNVFGEVEDHILEKQRYAKFKAADILKAFRLGLTPTAGPPGGEEDPTSSGVDSNAITAVAGESGTVGPPPTQTEIPPESQLPPPPPPVSDPVPPPAPNEIGSLGSGYPTLHSGDAPIQPSAPSAPVAPANPAPAPTPSAPPVAAVAPISLPVATPGHQPCAADIQQAQKYAKWAVSSLQYDDVPTAVKNLTDALHLLTSSNV